MRTCAVAAVVYAASPPPVVRRVNDRRQSVPAHFAVAESLRLRGRPLMRPPVPRSSGRSLALGYVVLWRAQVGVAEAQSPRSAGQRVGRDNDALRFAQGDPGREGRTLTTRSFFLEQWARFEESMADAVRARDLGRAIGARSLVATAHRAMGRVYSVTGRSREALEAHRQELAIRQGGEELAYALALGEMGIDLRRLGRMTEAVEVYEEALAIYERRQNPEGIARTSFNLGNVYVSTGDLATAERLFKESSRKPRRLATSAGSRSFTAAWARLPGVVQPSPARTHYERGRELPGALAVLDQELLVSIGLGSIEIADGRLDAAQVILDSSFARAITVPGSSAGGRRARQPGDVGDSAARSGRSASGAWRGERNRRHASRARVRLRRAATSRTVLAEAEGRADATSNTSAVDFLESWRGRNRAWRSPHERGGAAAGRLRRCDSHARRLGTRGDAFAVAERARARLLLEVMAERFYAGTATTGRADSLRARLREASALRASGPARTHAQLDMPDHATHRFAHDGRARERPRRLGARGGDAMGAAAVRSGLLTPHRALLAYFWATARCTRGS